MSSHLEIAAISSHPEQQYLNLIRDILDHGSRRETRNGITISTFGTRMEFDISHKIPILTTKRVAWKTVIRELLWFISGSTDNRKLREVGVKIWDGNASREYLDSIGLIDNPVDDLGPIYGFQWRHSGAEYHGFEADYTGKGVDQLAEVVKLLRTDPHSRRILFSAWNPSQMSKMALPPCHVLAQFYVRPPSTEESDAGIRGHLSCQLYQRSGDVGLGVPFNIASYATLTYMLAHITGMRPDKFIHILGDTHIYADHEDALRQQIIREPLDFPTLEIRVRPDLREIDDFIIDDFILHDYNPHGEIKMTMSA